MKITRLFAAFALAAVALCAAPVSAHSPPGHDSAFLHSDAGCALAPEAPVAAADMAVDNSTAAPEMQDIVLVLIDAPAVGYRLHIDPGRDIA